MSGDSAIRSMLALCTAVLMAVALYLGRSIFAPVALSLFGLACVWPFQRALQSKVPKLIALVFTLLLTLVVLGVLGLAVAWGSGQVGHWLLGNVERFQFIYMTSNAWLEERGIFLTGMLAERFDVSWLVAYVQQVAARLNSMVGFVLLAFAFMMLGLMEVDHVAIQPLDSDPAVAFPLTGGIKPSVHARDRRFRTVYPSPRASPAIVIRCGGSSR